MPNPTPITFLIPGATTSPADPTQPHVRSVRLAATARGAGMAQRLQAIPGEDTVVITLGNGQGPDLKLRLHPENARDLLLAQVGSTGATARGAGLGRRLLAAVMAQQDWGAQYLTLGVSPDNTLAWGFYTRLGFQPRGYEVMLLAGADLKALR